MKNLYKKHKTHIIYSFKLRYKKILISLLILSFNITFWVTFKTVDKNFKQPLIAMATSYCVTHTSDIINKSVKQMQNTEFNYSNLCEISKNTEGDIVSLTTNSGVVNKFKLKLSEKIVDIINNTESMEFGIPIGNLTNTYILSGRGPKIPIRLIVASSPKIAIESTFESTAINQTKHRISIITNIDIKIILPHETIVKTVTSESLLCETIIVGKVPNVYVSK